MKDTFELYEDGYRLTSLVFGMTFFIDSPLFRISERVLEVYGAWIDLVNRDRLHYYATENMTKDRKISTKTLGMLPIWLNATSERRKYIALLLKNGAIEYETANVVFDIYSDEEDRASATYEKNPYLHLAFPYDEAIVNLSKLDQFFEFVCRTLPIQSATAGYGIETTQYERRKSETFAWSKSMRHPGLDIFSGLASRRGVGLDGLRSVNWLTMVDARLLTEAGGLTPLREKFPPTISVDAVGGGAILRAGAQPAIGDINRRDLPTDYMVVHEAFRAPIERCMERALNFSVSGDEEGTATERWFRRLEERS